MNIFDLNFRILAEFCFHFFRKDAVKTERDGSPDVERSRDNGDSPRGGKDNEAGGSSNEKAVRKHERSPSVENGNDNDPEEKEGASRSRSPTRLPST